MLVEWLKKGTFDALWFFTVWPPPAPNLEKRSALIECTDWNSLRRLLNLFDDSPYRNSSLSLSFGVWIFLAFPPLPKADPGLVWREIVTLG